MNTEQRDEIGVAVQSGSESATQYYTIEKKAVALIIHSAMEIHY